MNFDDGHDDDNDDIHKDINILSSQHTHLPHTRRRLICTIHDAMQYST
jgi:hypothetical protein